MTFRTADTTQPEAALAVLELYLAPGILGEGSLTLWLLVIGVNVQPWKEQASAAGLFVLTAAMGIGVFGLTMGMWLPHIVK